MSSYLNFPADSTGTRRRTCDELGVCQGRNIPCLNCTQTDAPEWQPDEVTCTPFERMGYWLTILVVSCLSGGAVVGSAAYIYGRWFA